MTQIEQSFFESGTRYFKENTSKGIDWEQRRYEIAKDMLAAWFSNSDRMMRQGTLQTQAKEAVEVADMLIEELKK